MPFDPGSPIDSEIREFGRPYLSAAAEKDMYPPGVVASFEYELLEPRMLAVNLLVSIVIASILTIAARAGFAAFRQSGFRFRLTHLLMLIAIVCLPLAGFRYLEEEFRHESAIIVELSKQGISVSDCDAPLFFRRLENLLPERVLLIWRRGESARFEYNAGAFDPQHAAELLRQLKHLERLHYPQLYYADDLLQVMPLLPHVRSIVVESTSVTDKGLDQLGKCDWLTNIEIDTLSVSPKQLRNLRQSLPNAEIVGRYEESSE